MLGNRVCTGRKGFTFIGPFKKCHFLIIRVKYLTPKEIKVETVWNGFHSTKCSDQKPGAGILEKWECHVRKIEPIRHENTFGNHGNICRYIYIYMCVFQGLYFVISWSIVVGVSGTPTTTSKPLILKEHGDKWDTSCFWQTRHLDQSCLGCKWYSKVSCKGIMIQLEHQEHHSTKCIDLEVPRKNEHMWSPLFPPEYQPPTLRTDQKVLYIHAPVVGFVLECWSPPQLHNAHSSLCCLVKCVFDKGFHRRGPQLSNWFWIQPIQWTRRWDRDAYWQASLDSACPFLANLTLQKCDFFSRWKLFCITSWPFSIQALFRA